MGAKTFFAPSLRLCSSAALNRVAVGTMEQDHTIRATVNNDRKEVQDVAAKNAHVQCVLVQASRVCAAKSSPLAIVAFDLDMRRNLSQIYHAADPTEAVCTRSIRKLRVCQYARANYRPVRTGIQRESKLTPNAVAPRNFRRYCWPNYTVVALPPFTMA